MTPPSNDNDKSALEVLLEGQAPELESTGEDISKLLETLSPDEQRFFSEDTLDQLLESLDLTDTEPPPRL